MILKIIPLLLVLLAACSSSGAGPGATVDPARADVLADLGEKIVAPRWSRFVDATERLQAATATASWSDRAGAQAAWRRAMDAWQALELFQFGPLGPEGLYTAGQGLRDGIYAWPEAGANPCRIDQHLLAEDDQGPGFFDEALVNAYGLDALEYLLFNDDLDTQCRPPQADIQAEYRALGDAIGPRRLAYARRLAARLVEDARLAESAWGRFRPVLAQAGADGNPFSRQDDALNEAWAAVFYFELVTKDRKLVDVLSETSPSEVESPWAGHGVRNIEHNARALKDILATSTATATFGGLVATVWSEADRAALQADLDGLLATAEGLPDGLAQAIASDRSRVEAMRDAARRLADALKGELRTALSLRLPEAAAGDTD